MTTKGIYNCLAKPALILILAVFVFFPVVSTATTTPQEENNEQSQTNNDSSSGNQGGTTSKNCPQNECPGDTRPNSPISLEKDLDQGYAATFLYRTFMSIGGFFAWFGGMALDTTISYLVIGMGEFVQGSMLTVINELWTIVRDIFNILFIFGLIYIGFKTILGTDETGTRRMLVTLIAAALLINFSLLFTKTIVDFSNAAAFQLYELVGGADSTYQIIAGGGATRGIAASFLQTTDITSFANPKDKAETKKMGDWNFIVYGFFGMILMVIAAFVFLAGAFMLIARFIILIFSMIFSPAMFLGWIFPQFNNLSTMWWSKFLGNAFMAPAYIFMLFLTLKLIQTIRTSGSIFEALQGDSYTLEAFSIMIVFFVMIGFLYGSLLVSQKMGAAGATQVMGVSKNIQGRLKSYATQSGRSAVGRTAQATVGGAAAAYGNWLDKRQAESGKPRNRWLTRPLRNAASNVENAKFGAKTSRKDRKTEDEQEYAKAKRAHAVNNIQTAIEAGSRPGATAEARASAERAIRQASNAQIQEITKTKEGRDMILNQAGSLTPSQVAEMMKSEKLDDEFQTSLRQKVSEATMGKMGQKNEKGEFVIDPGLLSKASKAQLKAMGVTALQDPKVAVHLTADQIKHVESEMTESEAEVVKAARKTELINAAKGNSNHKSKEELLGMNPSELPKEALIELAPNLPVGTIRKIAADNKTDPKTAKAIRDRIVPGLKEPPKNPATGDYIKPGQPGYKNEYDMWRFLNIEDRGRSFGRTENSPSDSDKDTDQYELPL